MDESTDSNARLGPPTHPLRWSQEGKHAFHQGCLLQENPYAVETAAHSIWEIGWWSAYYTSVVSQTTITIPAPRTLPLED